MTEVVDIIKIEVTLHHCMDELKITPLREQLPHAIEALAGMIEPCREGAGNFGDKISWRWSHTGLHEIPELTGGDN